MQTTSARVNADYKTLPLGWVAHYDQQRNMWYYVNLNATPPLASFVHPDDQRDHTSHIQQPARPYKETVPTASSTLKNRDQDRTRSLQVVPPFIAVTEARSVNGPTFAQKLYASSLPASLSSNDTYSQNPTADANGRPSSSHTRSSDINVYVTPPLSPNVTFSMPSSSPSVGLSPPPTSHSRRTSPNMSSRRPRGARSPSFPRLSLSDSERSLADERAGEFGERVLQNPPVPNTAPQVDRRAPLTEANLRHHRSATVPTLVFNPTTTIQKQIPKSTQVPNHKVTICSPIPLPESAKITTPAFQVHNGSQHQVSRVSSVSPSIRPVLPAIIIPNSSSSSSPAPRPQNNGTMLPMGAVNPHINEPKVYIPPTQNSMTASTANLTQSLAQGSAQSGHAMMQSVSNPNANHDLLKKVGVAVGKTAGKAALRLGTKMILENIGIESPDFGSGDLMDTVSAGISEVAVSAASHAIASAANSALNPSSNPVSFPPSSSTHLSPEYTAILQQMETMRRNQQITPQQNALDPSEISHIIDTMHAMQIKHEQHKPLAQNPSGYIGAPYGVQNPGHIQNSSPQPPHWQQSLINNVIGEATNALVSGAVADFDFAGTTENAMSSFNDFTSFDPSAS